MEEDILTQKHAHVIAHDFGFWPIVPLKCERTIPVGDHNTLFFANTSNIVKVTIGYNCDEIMQKLIAGDACTCCWSEGKIWENETVPKFVFCTLSGFQSPVEFLNWMYEPGEPIKVGCYMLEQKNCPDCTYEYLDDTKEIIWTPDDVLSTIIVKTHPDNIVRMDSSAAGCFKLFKENGLRAEINLC